MRFKVGDVVRLKEGLKAGEWYGGILFKDGMKHCYGSAHVVSHARLNSYKLEGFVLWNFSEEMLDPVRQHGYNVGDRVRVHRNLIVPSDYGCCIILSKKGDVVTIKEKKLMGDEGRCYTLEEDPWHCCWPEGVFEPVVTNKVAESPKFKVGDMVLVNSACKYGHGTIIEIAEAYGDYYILSGCGRIAYCGDELKLMKSVDEESDNDDTDEDGTPLMSFNVCYDGEEVYATSSIGDEWRSWNGPITVCATPEGLAKIIEVAAEHLIDRRLGSFWRTYAARGCDSSCAAH